MFTREIEGTVSIDGNAVYGETLTANTENVQEDLTLSYQWKADGVKVGTDSRTYTVSLGDIGKKLTVEVSAEGTVNSLTASSEEVSKRALAVTADAKSKVYGQPDPELTYQITSGSLINGDTLTGTLTRTSGESAGDYDIQNTLKHDGYNISYTDAKLTIQKKPLSWDVSDLSASKPQDGTMSPAALNGELKASGILNGDDAVLRYEGISLPDFPSAEAGSYPVKAIITGGRLEGTHAGNYILPENAPEVTAVIRKAEEITPPPEEDGKKFKLVQEEGISEVPESLKQNPQLDTPDKIIHKMKTEVSGGENIDNNSSSYDVTLLVSIDNGKTWVPATEENFPKDGRLPIVLPYPNGTGKNTHSFKIVHMFTINAFGQTAGDVEILENEDITNTDDGISCTVTGLSPILVTWEENKPVTPSMPGSVSGSSVSNSDSDEEEKEIQEFWPVVQDKIEAAKLGTSIKVNAGDNDRMPAYVMKALKKKKDVTLTIRWDGGKDIVIPSSKALDEPLRMYYPLAYLEGIVFDTEEIPSALRQDNPSTGGDIWDADADDFKVAEITAVPPLENSPVLTSSEPSGERRAFKKDIPAPDSTENPEVQNPAEPAAGEELSDNSGEPQKENKNFLLGAAAILAAIAGYVFIRRRTLKKDS